MPKLNISQNQSQSLSPEMAEKMLSILGNRFNLAKNLETEVGLELFEWINTYPPQKGMNENFNFIHDYLELCNEFTLKKFKNFLLSEKKDYKTNLNLPASLSKLIEEAPYKPYPKNSEEFKKTFAPVYKEICKLLDGNFNPKFSKYKTFLQNCCSESSVQQPILNYHKNQNEENEEKASNATQSPRKSRMWNSFNRFTFGKK